MMFKSLFMLIAPTALCFSLHVARHGGELKDFGSTGVMWLLPLLLLALHIALLLFLSNAWFCGQCHYRQETATFLMPGVGYGLVLFPSISAPVIRGIDEQIDERAIVLIGWFLIAIGPFSVLLNS